MRCTKFIYLFSFLFLFSMFARAQNNKDSRIMGFISDQSAQEQKNIEKQFDQNLSKTEMENWMKRLAAKPHHAGSPYGKENAHFLDSLFSSWGYQTEIKTYYPLFPTPKIRELTLLEPVEFEAGLEEKAFPEEDPYTDQEGQLPPYNAYSADGDVTGELVYVNYGSLEDYKKLEEMGISVKGKIVIARYGKTWRGVKPKLAYEHGAIGTLIYSDPQDEGYAQGETYPKGPYKNPYAVQRGSVINAPLYPGDPLTPGYAATKNAKRLDRNEAESLKKIPVLPISYHDAQPLLENMSGPVAPPSWRGALPITYHVGPGASTVHLKLEFNWDLTPVYDVIATMKGAEYPDQWVLRGNHHDAWVNGARDPVGGLVALLSEAKSIAQLKKKGWHPKRTIKFTAWDAEEPMLLGSTEWVEDHQEELKKKAIMYINTDMNQKGTFSGTGSPTVEKFISEILFEIPDPDIEVSLGERKLAELSLNRGSQVDRIELYPIGTGSDYTSFVHHIGVPSTDLRFSGAVTGEYHTLYDTYPYFKRFVDPGFKYTKAMAQLNGRVLMRMVNADILPFDFTRLSNHLNQYSKQLQEYTDSKREKVAFKNKMVNEGAYQEAGNRYTKETKKQNEVPEFDFSSLDRELDKLQENASQYDQLTKQFTAHTNKKIIRTLNQKLQKVEQNVLTTNGLPGQKYYKNVLYAPGKYTGYGAKTLPGVRQAIELGQYDIVDEQIDLLTQTLKGYNQYLKELISLLE